MAARTSIAAVRQFNRFYTRQIGVLRKTYLDSPYSLGEMRVLYELAHADQLTASDIARALDLDAGYLSRLLRNFEKRGLISRKTSQKDGRQSHLALTACGRKLFASMEERSQRDAGAMLDKLEPSQQTQIVAAMTSIETLLTNGHAVKSDAKPRYTFREPRAGDFGWLISRHAELYLREHGWGAPFDGLYTQIVADYDNKIDPERERCWMAEMNGEKLGVGVVGKDEKLGVGGRHVA